jgi:oxygen-independent coproporphyrinogen-3 oxidase
MRTDIETSYGDERLPRYTSYPTAPHFSNAITHDTYSQWLADIPRHSTASLYLHIPFCRSMCWYCGCHTTIVARDAPIATYVEALRRESDLVSGRLTDPLSVNHIHFGGGTPTIMTPAQFAGLIELIARRFVLERDVEIAVEIDPRTLTQETISELGFSRVTRASLGVQSFDPAVQAAINRVQSFEQTAAAVNGLRAAGIRSVNFDLIYGLPHQTIASCIDTVEQSLKLRPDRFAVFGYAHVPQFKKHQRLIDEAALANGRDRRRQAEAIANALIGAGYHQVGFDHFALPEDSLVAAQATGQLHRNFQGYTTDTSDVLIGLGASAIGRLGKGYIQNEIAIGTYRSRIADGQLATRKGYALSADDRLRADVIERLMCRFQVNLKDICAEHDAAPESFLSSAPRLHDLIADGLVRREGFLLTVADDARHLVRVVASAFDAYIGTSNAIYSRAV